MVSPFDPRVHRVPAADQASPAPVDPIGPPAPGQLAAAFSRNRWGLATRPVLTRPTATTTAANVLGNNPKRLFWMVINRGTTDVNLDINATATTGNGVLLAAGGGYCSADVLEDAEMVAYPVSVVAASGTPQLWVLEIEAI